MLIQKSPTQLSRLLSARKFKLQSLLKILAFLLPISLFFNYNTSSNSVKSVVKIQFFRNKKIQQGEAVYVCGNDPALGDWDPFKGLKLNNRGGDDWVGEVFVQAPADIEYRYYVSSDLNPMKNISWEEGLSSKMSVVPVEPNFEDTTFDINIMSFNLRYDEPNDGKNAWPYRKEVVAEVIEDFKGDFVGQQEVLFHMALDLQFLLPNYSWYGRGRDAGSESGEANPIFYRHNRWEFQDGHTFWLSDTPDVPASATFGNGLPRICTWGKFKSKINGIQVLVYNCHWDHKSANAKIKGATVIKKHIAKNMQNTKIDKVILMGDWNSIPNDEGVRIAIEDEVPLKDTYPIAHDRADHIEYGTAHGFNGVTYEGKIDYIVTSQDFETLEFKIGHGKVRDIWPSDHFPVMARTRVYL